MKNIIAVLTLTLLFACSKDQKAVRNIEGEWKVTSLTYNGTPEDPESYEGNTVNFEKCKVRKEDCDGSMSYAGFMVPFKYSIYDDAAKVRIYTNFIGLDWVEEGEIVELSETKLRMTTTNDNNDVTEWTLERP